MKYCYIKYVLSFNKINPLLSVKVHFKYGGISMLFIFAIQIYLHLFTLLPIYSIYSVDRTYLRPYINTFTLFMDHKIYKER